jgi:FixJ family two-component response regulator/tetratricopeptide (TPR) repeat protein
VTDEVLLVGDDPELARLATDALEAQGIGVSPAPGGAAAAVLAAREVACVVLCAGTRSDDALAILRCLHEHRPTVPVVVVATAPAVEVVVRAMKAGAADVVETGRVVTELARAVRGAVDAGVGARRTRLVRRVFVGRETELRFLESERARAAAGHGRVVLLAGDNGIGKTTLAFELARRARAEGTLVLWAHCDDAHAAPAYWPWTKILRDYVGAVDRASADDDLGKERAVLASLVPSLREIDPDTEGAETGEVTRFHLFDAVIRLLRRAAARRPLVCVLDDLHEADADSLHLLRALTADIAGMRLLVIAAHRDAAVHPPVRAALGRIADHPATSVVRLSGFDETDVWRYIAEATDVRPPRALVRAIVRQTAGNPLFVADVVSLLAADDRLEEDPGEGELRLVMPESRRQAVADRLARLGEPCRRILEAAALVGPEVELESLVSVVGRDLETVRAAVDEAIAHRLVVSEPGGGVRFANVLVREVLCERVPPRDRPRLHGRIAEALEARASGGGERPLAAIAHHRLEAATCAADVARAFGYVVAAAQRAAELMAHEEAARYYEVALGVAERAGIATAALRTDLLVELAEAHWRAGHTEAAREVGRRALAVAKEGGEPGQVAAAALAFAGRLPGFGAIACDEEVVAELERALAALPPTATALRAMLMARLAEELTYLPRRTADRTLAPKAITLARSLDDPAVLASVLRTTQWSVWTPDDVERRRQLAEEIVALAARTRDPVLALDGELLRLWSALEHGEMDVARHELVVATRLAERLRLPYYAWITTMARACLHIATGRFDEAERVADEALRTGDPISNPTVPLFVGAQRGHIMWHRGRFAELARWLTDVVGGFPMLAATLDCSLVITYAEAGQRELARAELARFAADDFAGVPRNPMWLMNMTSLAQGCVVVGDVDAASRLYPKLAPFARHNVVIVPVWVGAPVAHYMAGLAALLGDVAAARRHFEDALVLEARTGTRQWGARTQLAYARLLRTSGRAGDAERAAELLASARAIAVELGLVPVLETADAVEAGEAAAGRICRLHRRGEEWDVEFAGRRATVRHRVGMDYLRVLLERPGEPVPVLDLASAGGRGMLIEGGDPPADRQTVREVHRRIAELEDELAACADRGAAANAAVRAELATCRGYLAAHGGGLLSAADRARPSVRKAIDRAITALIAVHPVLGHHLRRHVETGRTCVYVPDIAMPVRFDF